MMRTGGDLGQEVLRKARLADARLARDGHHTAPLRHHRIERVPQLGALALAADRTPLRDDRGHCRRHAAMGGKLGQLAIDVLRCGPQRGVLGKHPENQPVEQWRQLRHVPGRRQRMRFDDRMEHCQAALQ